MRRHSGLIQYMQPALEVIGQASGARAGSRIVRWLWDRADMATGGVKWHGC